MPKKTARTGRRPDALSKDRIVEAAIAILDADGERALTFTVLTERLSTGAGAIYWHVANKDELLSAAADHAISGALAGHAGGDSPNDEVRAITLAVFDAIDAHPWVGTQLSREPWQPAVLRIFDRVGSQLGALGLADKPMFDSASALVNFVLGLAGQYAAGARLIPAGTDRSAFLEAVAARWTQLDSEEYPFVHQLAAQLPEHDDRHQFLAGIDIILAGIATLHPQAR